jgi:2-methylcitrate dehydratase PrpD
MGPTEALSRFIAGLRYQDLPADVIQAAKIAIMDGVSVMLAGTVQPLAVTIRDYTRELGGSPNCTVVGSGFKTNAPSAAFANGVFGHCLDFEIQGDPPTHGTSSCLPAALSLGEIAGSSGQAIIESYVLGWEVQGRVRAATAEATNPAYHPPGLVGPLGSAAASARVLDLDADSVRLALGMAASRTGGLTANTGTMVKSTHPGNAARMGVEAAMLARTGFTSNENILEAPLGYADALFDGEVKWDVITEELGASYRLVEPGFDIKRFPAQIHMQRPIESVLNLRERYNLRPDDVQQLVVETQGQGHSGPIPKSGLDGKFSIEYCAAAALLDGNVGIDTFTDERRFAQDMEDTLPRMRVESTRDAYGAQAVATLRDGSIVSAECRDFTGASANPMSDDARIDKFEHCARRLLSERDTQSLIDTLEHLEDVDDVSDLMAMLAQRQVG